MSRRFATACAVAAVMTMGLPALPSAAADGVQGGVISSDRLSVEVASDFPRVVSYTDLGTGASLAGSTAAVTKVTLDGKAYDVQLAGAPELTGDTARYTLTFPALPGVEIDAHLAVSGRTTTFKVDAVRDTDAFRVHTIDIPGHDLVSVASTDQSAETAFTRLDPNSTTTADVFGKVTGSTAAEANPVGASYAIVNTGQLAAAVESNSSYDKPSGATGGDDARFWHQARKAADGTVRVGVWSGQWTYRGDGAPQPESGADLPWAKVVVTPDANGDGAVDWQDGAVAFRGIGIQAPGGDDTANQVITHIPFNFASQATHPFLRTLDDVKRISLATDGLGQRAVLKGYGSEGHDSAHPDYGGNYNKRAGGLADLNTLAKQGKQWGATFGVHVNATESYPEAHNFDENLVNKNSPGWNWLNQSYYINQRYDINSGRLADRFQQLRDEADPNLSFLYIDVYYTHGWIADKTIQAVQRQGWNVGTEWADKFEHASLWSHWANDVNYGGATNKGLNSQIIRFIRNGEKDVWNSHPLLGNARIEEFEGWTGETNWNVFYKNIWQNNLPAKYLQHYAITDWDADSVDFTGGVRALEENGKRTFYAGDAKVLDGEAYLLPWKKGWGDAASADKLYHYNDKGGRTTWTVPADYASAGQFEVYELTDNGRKRVGTVKPSGGKITLTAEAGRPYVLYPVNTTPAAVDPQWGEGSKVSDPGFNDEGLDTWDKTGAVANDTDNQGRRTAVLSGNDAAALEQRITGLEAGKRYTASVNVEIEPGKERTTTLSVNGRQLDAKVSLDRSTLLNKVAADEKHDTYFQRVKLNFTAPSDGALTLRLEAAAGSSAKVRADDVRIVRNAPATKAGALVFDDFEDVDQGWGPFVKGGAGGSTDPRTHIAQLNAPYTQAGWNNKLIDDVIGGAETLKAHDENAGLVYRTAPWTVPMKDGRAYKVEYDYQSSHAGAYEWVTGYDQIAGGKPESVETRLTPVGQQRTTAHFTETVTAGCGDTWVGLRKRSDAPDNADLVLDDFTVTDLGPASEPRACANIALSAPPALEPGQANEVKAVFSNYEAAQAAGVTLDLALPAGWTAEPAGRVSLGDVAAGGKATATWSVTPPVDAAYKPYTLSVAGAYTVGGAARSLDQTLAVRTLQPPPTTDTWTSDMDWVSAENGWGPVEKDMSNGGTAAGDGTPITIAGTVYAKGIGSHAPARIRYYLGAQCTSFTATVGVDDAQPTRGSVQFSVEADGTRKVQSPILRATDAGWSLTADVSGAKYVDLVVGDGGDGNGNDHASWGGAKFHCGG
ncbi:endo-alpha-N-acetylgalactosaminidase family protein [Streptomyces sp. NPDC051940]|uniref:endo-alpha-N-acetylgalactosaminidase family protein n=1 Tax=Streptomyces sp. NPDC051940 TaxID=3155675 RepID=UPI00343DFAD7